MWGLAGQAHAQDADDTAAPADNAPVKKDPAAAKKWLSAAQQLVQRGDAASRKGNAADAKTAYANAVVAYGRAIDAGEDAANINVYVALAQLEDRTGAYPDAIKHYKIVAAMKGVPAGVAKTVANKLDALSGKVGLVTLQITPDGTEVSIDGNVVGKSPLPDALVLMPGKYKLALSADGYKPKDDLEIVVEAGSESERKLDLEPSPVLAGHSKHEEKYVPPPPPKAPRPSKLPIEIGLGVTGAGVVGGVVLGSLALRWHGKLVDPSTPPNARLDAQQFGRQEAHGADACFGVSLVAAGFSAYWYFVRYKHPHATTDDSANPNAPKLVLAPWVQPDVGGLAAVGQF